MVIISFPIFTIISKWQLLQVENDSVNIQVQLEDLDGITLQDLMNKIEKKYNVKTEYSDKDEEFKKIEKLLNYDEKELKSIQTENPLSNMLQVSLHEPEKLDSAVKDIKAMDGVIDAGYGGKEVKLKLEENKSLQSKLKFVIKVICTLYSLCYLTYINTRKNIGIKSLLLDMSAALVSIMIFYIAYIGVLLYLNIDTLYEISTVTSKISSLVIVGVFMLIEVTNIVITKLQSFFLSP